MTLNDHIREMAIDPAFEREPVADNSAVEMYYKDLQKAIGVEDFPIILVDTLLKRTYKMTYNGRCFLVFDMYLMEIMRSINRIILEGCSFAALDNFFNKIISEECFVQDYFSAAINFSSNYMNALGVERSDFQQKEQSIAYDYSFIQQAFLIAHEIFHFYVGNNPDEKTKSLMGKEHFLQYIYQYTNKSDSTAAASMKSIIGNKKMIEECLCDSTAIIHITDIGKKLGTMDIVDSCLAAALAVMCQFTLSIVQKTVKNSGDYSYEDDLNKLNFRIVHLKEFCSYYISEEDSKDSQREYQEAVEELYHEGMQRICRPLLYKQFKEKDLFSSEQGLRGMSSEQIKRVKKVLKETYKTMGLI